MTVCDVLFICNRELNLACIATLIVSSPPAPQTSARHDDSGINENENEDRNSDGGIITDGGSLGIDGGKDDGSGGKGKPPLAVTVKDTLLDLVACIGRRRRRTQRHACHTTVRCDCTDYTNRCHAIGSVCLASFASLAFSLLLLVVARIGVAAATTADAHALLGGDLESDSGRDCAGCDCSTPGPVGAPAAPAPTVSPYPTIQGMCVWFCVALLVLFAHEFAASHARITCGTQQRVVLMPRLWLTGCLIVCVTLIDPVRPERNIHRPAMTDCYSRCVEGKCLFADCSQPAECVGGKCKFTHCFRPTCEGGWCLFERCVEPSCSGGSCREMHSISCHGQGAIGLFGHTCHELESGFSGSVQLKTAEEEARTEEKKPLAARDAADALALAKEKNLEEKALTAREAADTKAIKKAAAQANANAKMEWAKTIKTAHLEDKALTAREAADAKAIKKAEAQAKDKARREEKALAAREAADTKAIEKAEAQAKEKAHREEKALAARKAAEEVKAQAEAKAKTASPLALCMRNADRWGLWSEQGNSQIDNASSSYSPRGDRQAVSAQSSRRLCALELASGSNTSMSEMAQGTVMLDEWLRPVYIQWSQIQLLEDDNLTRCEREVLRPEQPRNTTQNSDLCTGYAECVASAELSVRRGFTDCPKLTTEHPERLVGIGQLPKHGASDLRATLEVLNKHNQTMVIAGDSVSHLMCSWMICELIGSGAELLGCETTIEIDEKYGDGACGHGVQCSFRWPDGLELPAPVFFLFVGSRKPAGRNLYDPKRFSYNLGNLETDIKRLKNEGAMLIFNGGLRFNGHSQFLSGKCGRRGTTESNLDSCRDGYTDSANRLHRCVMEDWLKWLDEFGSRDGNIAIWRETTAQGNPTANGYFEYTAGSKHSPSCVSVETQSKVFSYHADWRNRIVYEILESSNSLNVHILPLFRNSLRQIFRNELDCTHSCLTPLLYKPLWLSLYHIAVAKEDKIWRVTSAEERDKIGAAHYAAGGEDTSAAHVDSGIEIGAMVDAILEDFPIRHRR